MAVDSNITIGTAIVLLALVFSMIVNYSDTINISDGDRLVFGAIGIAGFLVAVLTTEENNNDFVL